MSKDLLTRLRRIEEERAGKVAIHVQREGEPEPVYDPNDGKRHIVVRITRGHFDPKTGEEYSPERIAEIEARIAAGPPDAQSVVIVTDSEPVHAIEIGEIPTGLEDEPPSVRAWWLVEKLEDADFSYYPNDRRAYLKYTSEDQVDKWERNGLCPPPLGAMISNWPPATEKDWKRCKGAYEQTLEDERARGKADELYKRMEAELDGEEVDDG